MFHISKLIFVVRFFFLFTSIQILFVSIDCVAFGHYIEWECFVMYMVFVYRLLSLFDVAVDMKPKLVKLAGIYEVSSICIRQNIVVL